jgi:hypothetical protein
MVLGEESHRRPMHGVSIPDQDHPATIMMMECPQEPNDVFGVRIFPQELKIMR